MILTVSGSSRTHTLIPSPRGEKQISTTNHRKCTVYSRALPQMIVTSYQNHP